ncbi:hypothetical protein TNCT_438201, partial [Trichonephila clavata]
YASSWRGQVYWTARSHTKCKCCLCYCKYG